MTLGGSFWRLLASSGTSNFADGTVLVATPLLAASITRDPVQVSALTAVAYVPWLLFAVPGGALVDRLDRRRAMACANLVRAVVWSALAVVALTGSESMTVIYLVTFAAGLAEVVYDSSARAILPQVVGKSDLDRGNSYMTVVETVGNQFAAAPLAAVAFAAAAASPFFGASAAYLLAVTLILTVRGGFRPEREQRTGFKSDVVEGMRWLRNHAFLRGLTLSAGWFGLMQAMVNGVLVLYALETLDLEPEHFGFYIVAAATGSILGGLVAPRLSDRVGRGTALVGATVVSPISIIGMGLTTSPGVSGVLFGLSAGAVTVWNVLSMSIRQAIIPEALFGRVLGAYRMVIWGVIPLGALTGGVLADLTTLGTVLVVAGAGQLSASAWIGVLMATHRREIKAAYTESSSAAPR